MKYTFLLLVVITMGSLPLFFANAQEALEVELISNKETVEVGESFQIGVDILRHSTNVELASGSVQIPGIENFDQRGVSHSNSVKTINGVGSSVDSTKITLVARKEGLQTIGPITLTYTDSTGAKHNITSEKLSIEIVPASGVLAIGSRANKNVATQNNQQKPLIASASPSASKELIEDDKQSLKLFLFFTVIVGGLVWYWLRRKKRSQIVRDQEQIESPDIVIKEKENKEVFHDESIEEKIVLPSEKREPDKEMQEMIERTEIPLPELGDQRKYAQIKKSLMNHLQAKHHIDAHSLTTNEIIEELHKEKIKEPFIEEALQLCDRAIFAQEAIDHEKLTTMITSINNQ